MISWAGGESDAILDFLDATENVVVIRVDSDLRLLESNSGFLRLLALPAFPAGEPLGRFLAAGPHATEEFPSGCVAKDIRLNFQSADGTTSSFFGRVSAVPGGWLIAGARLMITHSDILAKMSSLEEQLVTNNRELQRKVRELEEARDNIRVLAGLLPICMSCKKIRDDQGYWSAIEAYISSHSEARFSHGICPPCLEKLYPEHAPKVEP